MTGNPYPNIGFNPAPGDATQVATLGAKVKAAADAVTETNALLNRVRNNNDDVWKGDAGQAFRDNYDATLSQDLDRAQSALQGASTLITTWHADLIGFQDAAKGLETEAAAARAEHATAVTALQQAKTNPDLGLANQTFTDSAQLAAAQSRLDAASTKLSTAATAVNNCQSTIDAIIARATSLQTNHTAKARAIATELDAAANFSPSEPDKSIWDTIADWFKDNQEEIHDALAATSAVTGLLALVTPPPVSAVLGLVALASGLGALGMNALNPEYQDTVGDIMNGQFDKGAIGSMAATLTTDTLSVLPGAGGVIKGGKALFSEADTALSVANAGADVAGSSTKFRQVMDGFTDGAQSPGILSNKILDPLVSKIPDRFGGSEITDVLVDFSRASRHEESIGTTVGGIEMINRAAKGGLGAATGTSMISDWLLNG
ncbi:hypothetical protein [Nocardia sp. NPDC058705]|uniref:hypothetical protein n=1 Tax=Nocardia sp. NPDC058705 TaxID=3346609 RepID=UPI003695C1FC